MRGHARFWITSNICKTHVIIIVYQDMECSICLSPLTGRTGVLPCGHTFHRACVNKCSVCKCPLCQRSFDPYEVRPNFALESVMGTSTVQPACEGFIERMRSISRDRIDAIVEKSIPRVMTMIEKAARRGEQYINIRSSSLPVPWLSGSSVRTMVCRGVHDTMRSMGIKSNIFIHSETAEPVIHIHW
ncbi:hypothetical protein EB093_09455 [bacterium]|nr:hypothetical protein [bacterium]